MSGKTKKSTIFYGWFVVAACSAVTFTLGEALWAFGVFFKPFEYEFGWSRSQVSSGYSAFLIGYAISAIAAGRLADRYSPRPLLFTTALLAGLGISLCSQINSVTQLRLFLFIGGLGAGPTWSVPTSIVQRWFYERHRAGLALGIVISGVGIGGLIFTPLINYLILSYGWRIAFLLAGILFFIIIALSSLAIKPSPTEVRKVSERQVHMPKYVSTTGWATAKVVPTPPFIGIALIHCIGILAAQAVVVHLIPHATDVGISVTASAVGLGLLGGFSVPGRIISGFISDRLGWQKIMTMSLFGMALSLIWLLFLESAWMLYCFVFFFGICHGARVSTNVGILGAFFGMRSVGELIGITSAIGAFVGAFAPYMAGFIFDITGSYFMTLIIVIVLLLSAGLIASILKQPLITPKARNCTKDV